MQNHTTEFEWVIARYNAENATGKYALSLAQANTGYFLLNKERGKNDDIIVAFKRAVDNSKPFPQHLERASPTQVNKLDLLDRKRMGVER